MNIQRPRPQPGQLSLRSSSWARRFSRNGCGVRAGTVTLASRETFCRLGRLRLRVSSGKCGRCSRAAPGNGWRPVR